MGGWTAATGHRVSFGGPFGNGVLRAINGDTELSFSGPASYLDQLRVHCLIDRMWVLFPEEVDHLFSNYSFFPY